jgi:3-oxoadipate enol-lactonase
MKTLDFERMHGHPYSEQISIPIFRSPNSVDSLSPPTRRRIHIRIAGVGKPLLLLHGYPLDSRLWDRVIPLLADDFLCIAPDLRGFGNSAEETQSFTMSDLANDCNQLLDALQIRRSVTVCGLSMGGYVAMEFVNRYPERVANVILTNTRANADDTSAQRVRRGVAMKAIQAGAASVVLPMLSKLLCDQARQDQELVSLVERMMLETRPSTIAWAQLAMSHRGEFRTVMTDWEVPVCCIGGEQDTIAPVDVVTHMSKLARRSELHLVSSSSHLTPLEQPEQFARIVRSTCEGDC